MKTYQSLVQTGKRHLVSSDKAVSHPVLKPGCYTTHYDSMTNDFWFQEFETKHDSIIDLPSPEFKRLVNEMTFFLKPQTKEKFKDKGFLYKRSALLWGLPGTGKTIIVNRVVQEVIKSGGVVLFTTDPRLLPRAYQIIDDLQPNTMTLVIFEEFDEMIRMYGEGNFLNLLDGEVQKENVMYLATTNYIEKISNRIKRPGRMSSIIEIKYPNAECRKQYFALKMGKDFKQIDTWVEKTNGLSVDELKEVVQSVYIFEEKLETVVERLGNTRDFSLVESADNLFDESDY